MSAPDLSALVSARLCHDLISPMGAIGNGLELLEMSQGQGGAEVALITDSLGTAMARIRFYRLAFGPADAQARLSAEEAAQITEAMFRGRFTVTWTAELPSLPHSTVRLIYLALLCIERSLPMGGVVRVAVSAASIGLVVEGSRTTPPSELWAHVTRGAPMQELRPDSVQFPLLRQGLSATGHRIEVVFTPTGATLKLAAQSPILV